MINYPKRSDEIYKEIENFKDYELTQCVAYEMAIRNEDNLKKINFLEEYYNDNKKEIFAFTKVKESILYKEKYSKEFLKVENLIQDIDFLSYVYDDKRFSIGYILKEVSIHKKKQEVEDNYFEIHSETIKRDGYKVQTELTKVTNIDKLDYFYVGFSKILNDFQRPKIRYNSVNTKTITAEIDITKPLNEIISFITHIKKDLEENSEIIKAPIELIENEFQKDNSSIHYEKGIRKILSVQQKLANMFYIYDCIKIGATQRKIQNEVYNDYADNNIETKTLDAKTLKKYKDMAIDYIDNTRYKELVTGVSIENIIR